MIFIFLFILDFAAGQCEPFVVPGRRFSALETYCKPEIEQRTFQKIVRNPASNPIYLNGKMTCPPSSYNRNGLLLVNNI